MDPNMRMQKAVEEMLGKVDVGTLRPLRKDAFLCSAKCCDNSKTTPEQLQQCVNACQQKTSAAENLISQELEQFQQRLQRCAMTCSDKVQEKLPTDPAAQTPELINKLQAEAEACANRCVDDHLSALNKISERVVSAVKRM